MDPFFWQERPLDTLSQEEWEALCDGCARCCLVKLEDIDTGELHLTRVACPQLSLDGCRCRVYPRRAEVQPDCVLLTPQNLADLAWMPASCAYRLIAEGKSLPDWHPLICGHRAHVPTICRFAISERDLPDPDDLEGFIIDDYLP